MATIINEKDIRLQATSPRLLSISSNSVITVANNNVVITNAGTSVPATVEVQALFSGILTGTVSWSTNPIITSTPSGNTLSISAANIPLDTPVEVTATLSYLGNNYTSSTTITRTDTSSTSTSSYRLISSTTGIVNEGGGTFVPSTATFDAKTLDPTGELATYSGRLVVDITTDGSTYSNLYTSGVNESSYTYTPDATHKVVRVRLYEAGGTSTLLDEVAITVLPEDATDLSDVLFKNTSNILTGTIEPNDSGAIKVGSITWDSGSGALTGGTGVAITKWGIIGANSGAPKFTLEAATGDAAFAGTVNAGSVIDNTVTVSGGTTTMQDLVDTATFDLQTELDSGVESILAGVGSDYRLDVNTGTGIAVFRHKDALYKGNAGSGGIRPALGISSAGIAMGYNNASGTWINSVAISATGDATFAGTISASSVIADTVTINGTTVGTIKNNASTGASHAGSTGNPHSTSLVQISGDLDDISNGSTYFRTTFNEKTGGSRAYSALDSSNEYVRSLTSTKLSVVGSNPYTGWVGDSNGIRMYQSGSLKVNIPVSGNPTFSGSLSAATGTFAGSLSSATGTFTGSLSAATGTFTGSLTGSGGINITGDAIFKGNHSAPAISSVAVSVNPTLASVNGLVAESDSGIGLYGKNRNGFGSGVSGESSGSGGVGVKAAGFSGSIALSISGNINQSSGTSTTLREVTINGSGTVLTINGAMAISSTATVNNLTAENSTQLGGFGAINYSRYFTTQSGNANASSSRFHIQMAGSLAASYRFEGSGYTIQANDISDERLKEDISTETLGLDFIKRLKPKTFRLKEQPDLLQHGFIAQDMAEMYPEANVDAMHTESLSDGMKGVGYLSMIAPTVKAIQELVQRVEELEARLEKGEG